MHTYNSTSRPVRRSAQPWSNDNRNQRSKCTNCGREGHTASRCWGREGDGRRPPPPSSHRQKNMGNKMVSAFAGEVSNSPPQCSTTVLSDGDYRCHMNKIINKNYRSGASFRIVDSGATYHITFDRWLFEKFSAVTGSEVDIGSKPKAKVCDVEMLTWLSLYWRMSANVSSKMPYMAWTLSTYWLPSVQWIGRVFYNTWVWTGNN